MAAIAALSRKNRGLRKEAEYLGVTSLLQACPAIGQVSQPYTPLARVVAGMLVRISEDVLEVPTPSCCPSCTAADGEHLHVLVHPTGMTPPETLPRHSRQSCQFLGLVAYSVRSTRRSSAIYPPECGRRRLDMQPSPPRYQLRRINATIQAKQLKGSARHRYRHRYLRPTPPDQGGGVAAWRVVGGCSFGGLVSWGPGRGASALSRQASFLPTWSASPHRQCSQYQVVSNACVLSGIGRHLHRCS